MASAETVAITQSEAFTRFNVEIVNYIDMIDLQYIVERYQKSHEHGFYGCDDGLEDLERIGSGSYGTVYRYKDYAIKKLDSANSSENDIPALKDLSHLDSIPTLYAVINNHCIVVDYVNGEEVGSYCHSYSNPLNIGDKEIEDYQNTLIEILKCGWSPYDLHEQNVMVCHDTGRLMIVDVGLFEQTSSNYEDYYYNNRGFRTAMEWIIDDYIHPFLRQCEEHSKINT